jgi:hypothetical protein
MGSRTPTIRLKLEKKTPSAMRVPGRLCVEAGQQDEGDAERLDEPDREVAEGPTTRRS